MGYSRWAIPVAALALAACSAGSGDQGGGFRQSVGLDVPPPDPFLTISRAPLQLPPDMTALPPPRPGAPSRVEPDAEAAALAALAPPPPPAAAEPAAAAPVAVASRAPAPRAPTPGETALLSAAGADRADPDVRRQIVAEAPEPERRFGLDSFLGFEIQQDPDAAPERLDPREESRRLRQGGLTTPVPPPEAP